MSKSVIIKGGSLTKLEEVKNTREIINKLVDMIDKRGAAYEGDLIKENETVAICRALESISESIGGINTTDSNVTVTNCVFNGLETGLKIEQPPKVESLFNIKSEEEYIDDYEEYSDIDDCEEYSDSSDVERVDYEDTFGY